MKNLKLIRTLLSVLLLPVAALMADEKHADSKTRKPGQAILIVIEEGGHTWPSQQPPVGFIGKSVKNISANDLMWEFFEKHPMK